MISDQDARDHIVTDLSASLAVDAGAGTGKTTLLLDRLSAVLLQEKIPLPRVVAITFTSKATGELIERLRVKLEQKLEEQENLKEPDQETRIRQALKDLEQASISTIHSFCSSILHEYPIEAGVDPQFVVLNQVQTETLKDQAWENWLKKTLVDKNECLSAFFKLGAQLSHVEEIKDYLVRNQSLLARPQVLPIPRAEETWEELEKNWKSIQALMKNGQEGDGLLEELKKWGKNWKACEGLRGRDLALKLALETIPSSKGPKGGNQKNWPPETLAKIREHLVGMKETQESLAVSVKDSVLQCVLDWLWDFLEYYAQVKAEKGFLDFDDLLSRTRDLLKKNLEVREELKNRFTRLFVDEFQDTDPLQVEIVFFLSEKKKTHSALWQDVALEPGKLFLVGDPQQSIYRFRRADVEIYSQAKSKLLKSGGKIEKLTENFRTVSPIVEWVNDGFEKLFQSGPFPYHPQKAHRGLEKNPKAFLPLIGLEIPQLPEEAQTADEFRKIEAKTVASFIEKTLHEKREIIDVHSSTKDQPVWRSVQAGDIAILFREISNTEAVYEEVFRAQGLPFQVVGGKNFYNRPEIVALETLLSCLESPAEEAGLVALLRSSLFGFTDEQLFLYRAEGGHFQFLREASGRLGEAFQQLKQWYSQTRNLSPTEVLLYLYDHTNLLAVAASQPNGEQRVANLMKIVDQCLDLELSHNFTYRAFVKWLSHQREEDVMEGEAPAPEETSTQITLMTLHQAKGLEFPVVILSGSGKEKPRSSNFIVNLNHHEVQFKSGDNDLKLWTRSYENAREEEMKQGTAEALRLLYVGCTRARESLVLPLFTQKKGGEFLRPIATQFDLSALHRLNMNLTPGEVPSPALAVDLDPHDQEKPEVQSQKEFLQKIQGNLKDQIEKRRGKNQIFSVTSMVHHQDDKLLREEYVLEGEKEPLLNDAQFPGKAFGVLTHQLLEKGWNWDAATLEKAAILWAPAMGLSREKAKAAAQLVSKAMTHQLLVRSKKASRVFRELTLTGKSRDGLFLNAVIDLAFLEADAWVVVDYKTDRDSQKGLKAYREQIGYYRQLLKNFTSLEVKESYLYFLQQDLVIRVE